MRERRGETAERMRADLVARWMALPLEDRATELARRAILQTSGIMPSSWWLPSAGDLLAAIDSLPVAAERLEDEGWFGALRAPVLADSAELLCTLAARP